MAKATKKTASNFSNLIGNALAGKATKKEKAPTAYYDLSKEGTLAVKLLGALNAIDKLIKTVTAYGRGIVLGEAVEMFAERLANGDTVSSMKVRAGDAECLIVPMRKYGTITEESVERSKTLGLAIDSKKSYWFNESIATLIQENPAILEEIQAVLGNSENIPAEIRAKIASGLLATVEEKTEYKYTNDILDNMHALSGGDASKALEILQHVRPVYTIRSYKINDKELEMVGALELLKENIEMANA